MSGQRQGLLLAVGFSGLAAIAVGWLLESSGYPSSLALEVGAGALLFAVLYYVEQSLVQEIQSVREESARAVEAVGDRIREVDTKVTLALEDLPARTLQILASRDEGIDQAFRALSDDVSWKTVSDVLEAGHSIGALDPAGPRVQFPGMWERLRFQRAQVDDTDILVLRIEELDGDPIAQVVWRQDEEPAEAFAAVVGELQKAGRHGQDVDPAVLLERLRDTVKTATDARRRRGGPIDLGRVIEKTTEQWAVTLDGMECLESYYPIPPERLADPDLPRHMSEKFWCDMDQFWEALPAAKALHELDPDE